MWHVLCILTARWCAHARDSRVRLERLAPEKWTTNDVGVWLGKEVKRLCPRQTCPHSQNAPVLSKEADPLRKTRTHGCLWPGYGSSEEHFQVQCMG